MRKLFCSLVVVAMLLGVAQAQSSTCNRLTDDINACVNSYIARVSGATSVDVLCRELQSYLDCIGTAFSCSAEATSAWNQAIAPYRGTWSQTCAGVRVTLSNLSSTIQSSVVSGDPHYTLLDGTVQTCNRAGWNLYAASRAWVVEVFHSPYGNNGGAAITAARVQFLHPAAPVEPFVFNLTSIPATQNRDPDIAVGSDYVRSSSLSLDFSAVKKTQNGTNPYFEVSIASRAINSGIIKDGCPNEAQPNNTAIPASCQNVSAAYQQACAYDARQVNENWAATSSRSAEQAAAQKSTSSTVGGTDSSSTSMQGVMLAMLSLCASILLL